MPRWAPDLLLNRQGLSQRGPLLIAGGLAWVLLAQLWPGLPFVSALVLIGCGTSMQLADRKRSNLILANLAAYTSVVSLAIAAQWDLVLKPVTGHLEVVMLVDHAVAIVLLVLLMRWSVMVATSES